MGKISKLLKMQKKLVVPKGQYNSFGKYKYRSAEDIMVALKVVQEAENTVVVIDTDIETANGWNYINATATLYDADDGEVIAVTHGKAREAESKRGADESQITGSATSYAIKRALSGMFLIDDEKDADTLNDHAGYTNGADYKKLPSEQKYTIADLKKKLKENNVDYDSFVNTIFKRGVTDSKANTTMHKFESALKKYRELIGKQEEIPF